VDRPPRVSSQTIRVLPILGGKKALGTRSTTWPRSSDEQNATLSRWRSPVRVRSGSRDAS
jgi:hypothetical protein